MCFMVEMPYFECSFLKKAWKYLPLNKTMHLYHKGLPFKFANYSDHLIHLRFYFICGTIFFFFLLIFKNENMHCCVGIFTNPLNFLEIIEKNNLSFLVKYLYA